MTITVNQKNLIDLLDQHEYRFFERGDFNLNILGLRKARHVTDAFDDELVLIYKESGRDRFKRFQITTKPGLSVLGNSNQRGVAVLKPGQWRGCYGVGMHKGQYKALSQTGPVTVYRDNNRNNYVDYGREDTGLFGINIHRASPVIRSTVVGAWSAGCQVFADPKEFSEFLSICDEARTRYGNSFTYTLLDISRD